MPTKYPTDFWIKNPERGKIYGVTDNCHPVSRRAFKKAAKDTKINVDKSKFFLTFFINVFLAHQIIIWINLFLRRFQHNNFLVWEKAPLKKKRIWPCRLNLRNKIWPPLLFSCLSNFNLAASSTPRSVQALVFSLAKLLWHPQDPCADPNAT